MDKEKFYKSLEGVSETRNGKLKGDVSSERWEIAHVSEEEFWKDFSEDLLEKVYAERFKKKSQILLREWRKYIEINKDIKILQIGCGPEDVINHFEIGERYSIDPLADFYKKRFKLDYDSSHLIKAMGEKIPFEDNYFDIVILANVLDHTNMPIKVLSEINRVLKKGGILYFENYIYQKKFLRVAKLWGLIKEIFKKEIFNIHHPYMFTMQDLKNLLSVDFVILNEEIGGWDMEGEQIEKMIKNFKNHEKLSLRFLAKFGVYSGVNYICVCRKNATIKANSINLQTYRR